MTTCFIACILFTAPADPTEVCTSEMSADVNFVVDASSSVTEMNWGLIKQFMNNVVDQFVIGDDNVCKII